MNFMVFQSFIVGIGAAAEQFYFDSIATKSSKADFGKAENCDSPSDIKFNSRRFIVAVKEQFYKFMARYKILKSLLSLQFIPTLS